MSSPNHVTISRVQEPTHVITIIHGAGEHSGRYDFVDETFRQQGMAVVRGDLPGHGHSPGLRNHIDRFQDYVTAGNEFLDIAREQFGDDIPHVLLGHSMGGLIASLMVGTAKKPLPDALVLSSPCFAVSLPQPAVQVFLGRILLPVLPRLYRPNGISGTDVTRDPQIASAYTSDPLVSNKVTLRWYFEFLAAMRQGMATAERVTIPTSIWQAGTDHLVNPNASRMWYELCGSTQKSFRLYPLLYHEIMNEPERDSVLQDIITWIKDACKSPRVKTTNSC